MEVHTQNKIKNVVSVMKIVSILFIALTTLSVKFQNSWLPYGMNYFPPSTWISLPLELCTIQGWHCPPTLSISSPNFYEKFVKNTLHDK